MAVHGFALERDLHGRAPGWTGIDVVQELRDEHGRAALERTHAFLQAAAAILPSTILSEGVRAAPPGQRVECHEKVVFSLPVEDLGFGGCVAPTRAKMKPKPMGHGEEGGREGEEERQQQSRHCQKSKTKDINSKKKCPICQTVSTAAPRATDSRNNPSGKQHSRHDWIRAKSSRPHCDRG